MLTLPKWQTVWLKSQYSSKKVSKKIMFPKPAEKILDDLSKCCGSSSKELTLEALNCWRIWIENQHLDNWRENETCYSAVRPLLTKKFHPLHKDSEVCEIKLSLMWLSLQKVQYLMHLEGPQHILEVFIKSCLSWLCSEEIDANIQDLILKLLSCLFLKDKKKLLNEKFSPLEGDVFRSRKFFCRLLNYFFEIFHNWTKVKQKADLLIIWNYFLDLCEQSFKFVPVAVWHRIFKLVENICGDERELFLNKIALIHKCAISLKSVMSNSKLIDCSQVLTTPAEVLLKIVVELSVNNENENISFELFKNCQEISDVLSNHIIDAFGFESCIAVLSKVEEIESKSAFWGLWCGMSICFNERVKSITTAEYSKTELKLYRKLRAVAANFDLDRQFLEETCVQIVGDQLGILRMPNFCEFYSKYNRKPEDNEVFTGNGIPLTVNELVPDFSGFFGFNADGMTGTGFRGSQNCSVELVSQSSNFPDPPEPVQFVTIHMNSESDRQSELIFQKSLLMRSADRRFASWNFISKTSLVYNLFPCVIIRNERLITLNYRYQNANLFTPVYLIVKLEEMCKNSRTTNGLLSRNCIDNLRKILNEIRRDRAISFKKFLVSFDGKTGVDFYGYTVKFWEHIYEIIHSWNFEKNLNKLITSRGNSVFWIYVFLFLVNFMKNLFVEIAEISTCKCNQLDLEEEMVLSMRIISFMNNVVHHKERLSRSAFIDNIEALIPKHTDNPLVLWTNFILLRNKKFNERETQCFQCCASEELSYGHDRIINTFKLVDNLRNQKQKEKSKTRKTKKRIVNLSEERWNYETKLNLNFSAECFKENKNVEVVRNPPDVFSTLAFSELNNSRLNKDFSECSPPKDTDRLHEIDTTPISHQRGSLKHNRISIKEDDSDDEMRSPVRKRKHVSDTNAEKVHKRENYNKLRTSLKRSKNSNLNKSPCTCGRLKENFSPSSMKNYSLRQRPLQRPSKFKDAKCLLGVHIPKKKSLIENDDRSLSPCRKCLANKFAEDNHHANVEVKQENHKELIDVNCTVKSDVKIEPESDVKDDSFKIKLEVVIDNLETETNKHIDMVISKLESEKNIQIVKEEFYADFVSAAPVETEPNSSKVIHEPSTAPVESSKDDSSDGEVNNRGVKRRVQCLDGLSSPKKLKIVGENECDVDEEIISKADVLFENIRERTPRKEVSDKDKNLIPRVEIPVIESRGSRILGLIPESPKLKRFQDSPPFSRQMRKPNMLRNSRASKMLALLPDPNKDIESTEDKTLATKDESCGRGVSGGKIHHLVSNRNGSALLSESPKRSPLRQRKSIRFDEDRNEIVTYYTDSPPCQVVKEGTRFRGMDKGREDLCSQVTS